MRCFRDSGSLVLARFKVCWRGHIKASFYSLSSEKALACMRKKWNNSSLGGSEHLALAFPVYVWMSHQSSSKLLYMSWLACFLVFYRFWQMYKIRMIQSNWTIPTAKLIWLSPEGLAVSAFKIHFSHQNNDWVCSLFFFPQLPLYVVSVWISQNGTTWSTSVRRSKDSVSSLPMIMSFILQNIYYSQTCRTVPKDRVKL